VPARVDVVIPCWNHGRYLAQAVRSVLEQRAVEAHPIVIDDGSTDDSAAVARGFGDAISFRSLRRGGVSRARNTGLQLTTAEFVMFLDADDYLEPDNLGAMLAMADRHPEADVFNAGWHQVDPSGTTLEVLPADDFSDDPFHTLLHRAWPACHSLLIRRRAFEGIAWFDPTMSGQADGDMWLRLAHAGRRFVRVPDVAVIYRQLPGSMSRSLRGMSHDNLRLFRHIVAYHGVCERCPRLVWDHHLIEAAHFRIVTAEVRQHLRRGELRPALDLTATECLGEPFLLVHAARALARRAKRLVLGAPTLPPPPCAR